jgi:FtsP/CotA-like multicopper oxidase with cupredoxin domain
MTWGYGAVPGPEIRVTKGDVLRVDVQNRLPEPTSIHWHGIAIRNDMDGVADVTQPRIAPGAGFTYEFTMPEAGTYWFHPHVGVQLDRGLYGPLIVDDPADAGSYDIEAVVMLDDWTDGVADSPDAVLAGLRQRGMGGMSGTPTTGGMSGMHGMPGMETTMTTMPAGGSMNMPMARSDLLGGDAGDVTYPFHLINGRPPADPFLITAKPGQRLRLRVINAGADTAYRVALGGHRLRLTHSDGFPIRTINTDAVLIGMGERYDAIIQLADGVFPLVALAEGKGAMARAIVRTGSGNPPSSDARPMELDGHVATVGELRGLASVALPDTKPDKVYRLVLQQGSGPYTWTINGRQYGNDKPLVVSQGQRTRIEFVNRSTMFHPMHLHGHTFQVSSSSGIGPRKDTVIVRPNETVAVDLIADNPGRWVLHCHNVYHQESGMMTTLAYEAR